MRGVEGKIERKEKKKRRERKGGKSLDIIKGLLNHQVFQFFLSSYNNSSRSLFPVPHHTKIRGIILSTQIHFPCISRTHLHDSLAPLRRHHRSQPRPGRQRRHKSRAYRNRRGSRGRLLLILQELLSPALAARASGKRGIQNKRILLLLWLLLLWLLLLLLLLLFLRGRFVILE